MMRETYADRHHHPPLLESAEIIVALLLMSACWFAWYVARERYHLTSRQLAELFTYLIIAGLRFHGSASFFRLRDDLDGKENGRTLPFAISRQRDANEYQRSLEAKCESFSATTFTANPGTWPDHVRVMQGIVLGMTGTGKTTLLRNIISQDLARVVGPPDQTAPHTHGHL